MTLIYSTKIHLFCITLLVMFTLSFLMVFLIIFFTPPPWVNQDPLSITCWFNNINLGTRLLWSGKSSSFTYKNKNVKFWCKADYGKKTKNKLQILEKWGLFSHCSDWKKCYVSVRHDGFFVSQSE